MKLYASSNCAARSNSLPKQQLTESRPGILGVEVEVEVVVVEAKVVCEFGLCHKEQ